MAALGTVTSLDRLNLVTRGDYRVTAGTYVSIPGLPQVALPSGTTLQNGTQVGALGSQLAGDLLSQAASIGNQVLASLATLRQTAETAANPGLLSGRTDTSWGTLQSDAQKALNAIDTAVRSGLAAIVASGTDPRVAATKVGNDVVTALQGLDSRALGLTGLDLTSRDAVSKVQTAVAQALTNSGKLQDLRDKYRDLTTLVSGDTRFLSDAIAGAARPYGATGTVAQTAPRGTVLNIFA
ncbi:MAG: hypothetical protein ACM31L_09895 [Actinomycetota bacterium]